MKTLITNYTFDASESKITFIDYDDINLERVLLIVAAKTNTVIYNFADSALGGTVATNVLTLTFDTSLMLDADPLLIYYDDPDTVQLVTLATGLNRTDDNVKAYPVMGTPVNLSASGLILSGPGQLLGFFVNSTSGGSVRFSDFLSASAPYLGAATIPPAVGFYKFPAKFATGGYVTIATAAIDVTFFVIAD